MRQRRQETIIISLITISENSSYWSPSPIFHPFDNDRQTKSLPFRGDSLMLAPVLAKKICTSIYLCTGIRSTLKISTTLFWNSYHFLALDIILLTPIQAPFQVSGYGWWHRWACFGWWCYYFSCGASFLPEGDQVKTYYYKMKRVTKSSWLSERW